MISELPNYAALLARIRPFVDRSPFIASIVRQIEHQNTTLTTAQWATVRRVADEQEALDRALTRFEIVDLPPTEEHVEACKNVFGKYRIDKDSRARRTNSAKPLYRLADGRYYVNRHLGHWRQFVVGVKAFKEHGKITSYWGVILGPVEPKRTSE